MDSWVLLVVVVVVIVVVVKRGSGPVSGNWEHQKLFWGAFG